MTVPAEPAVHHQWPKFFSAGTTLKLDRSFHGYSPADWSLSVLFAGRLVAKFDAAPQITVDPPPGNTFHVVLAPADTQPLVPNGGDPYSYTVIERLTAADGEVFDMARIAVMVNANIAIAVSGDFESPEAKLLRRLQDTLAARLAGGAVETYSVAGRSITRIPTKDLRTMIGQYKSIVWRQQNPGRLSTPGGFVFPTTDDGPFRLGPGANRWRP